MSIYRLFTDNLSMQGRSTPYFLKQIKRYHDTRWDNNEQQKKKVDISRKKNSLKINNNRVTFGSPGGNEVA